MVATVAAGGCHLPAGAPTAVASALPQLSAIRIRGAPPWCRPLDPLPSPQASTGPYQPPQVPTGPHMPPHARSRAHLALLAGGVDVQHGLVAHREDGVVLQ